MNSGSHSKFARSSKPVHLIADRVRPRIDQHASTELTFSARGSTTVRLRPQWVWQRLNDPCNWPAHFDHLTNVTRSDADMDEYLWSALGVTCPMRLTVREPPLHLAWQSVLGAEMRLSGEIILEPLEWYTRLTVQLHYVTGDSRLGLMLQTLEYELQRDLTRMTQALETRVVQVLERFL